MNYSWKIAKLGLTDQLNTDNVLLENAIVNIKWKRIVQDADGTRTSYVGNTTIDASNIAAADFVALNDVTSAEVTGWLTDALQEAGIAKIDAVLLAKVERKRLRNVSPSW